jgi:hypothetical protein
MRAIDEAGSSLLDNSQVLYAAALANGGHGTKDYRCCSPEGQRHLRP